MASETKTKGPASYFPSIEKTYGYPVSHWFAVLDKAAGLKHGEQVALLKGEHGLGRRVGRPAGQGPAALDARADPRRAR